MLVEEAALLLVVTVVTAVVAVEVEVVAVMVGVPVPMVLRDFGFPEVHHSLHFGEEAHALSQVSSMDEGYALVAMVRVVLSASASFASLRASIRFMMSRTCCFFSIIQSRCSVRDCMMLLALDSSILSRRVCETSSSFSTAIKSCLSPSSSSLSFPSLSSLAEVGVGAEGSSLCTSSKYNTTSSMLLSLRSS